MIIVILLGLLLTVLLLGMLSIALGSTLLGILHYVRTRNSHVRWSFLKSAFQISFCVTLFFHHIEISATLLLVAAIIGVIEEI